MKFVCLCFLLSKNSLGRSTSPQLLPHGVIHTLMNDVKDVYEEMSVHLPWDVTDGLEQSIILPRSTIGLSTAAPSRIVSCQGGPCFFVFPCCNISGNLSPGLKTKERRDGKLSPFETSERLKLWLVWDHVSWPGWEYVAKHGLADVYNSKDIIFLVSSGLFRMGECWGSRPWGAAAKLQARGREGADLEWQQMMHFRISSNSVGATYISSQKGDYSTELPRSSKLEQKGCIAALIMLFRFLFRGITIHSQVLTEMVKSKNI